MQGVLKGQLTAGQLPPVFILLFFFCLDNNLDLCRGGFVFFLLFSFIFSIVF